ISALEMQAHGMQSVGFDDGNFDRVGTLTPLGAQQVFDLTEPVTHSFIANGITVHNCSEYMLLDDTACNLASLNVLTFFDAEHRRFDSEGYKHGIRLWTIVLEISVLMASFPSREIAELSYKYRTLGLGYANLGAMLMQAGVPYDSEEGRAICAMLTAILAGRSHRMSGGMGQELGGLPGERGGGERLVRGMGGGRREHAAGDAESPARGPRRGPEQQEVPGAADHAGARGLRAGHGREDRAFEREDPFDSRDEGVGRGPRAGREARVPQCAD